MITLSISNGFSEKIQPLEYNNTKVYFIFVELVFARQKLLVCSQFNMLYNLSSSKMPFSKILLFWETGFPKNRPIRVFCSISHAHI
jgi:hypothetical protein